MKGKDTLLLSCQEDGSWDFEYPLTFTANAKYDHAFSLRNYTSETPAAESFFTAYRVLLQSLYFEQQNEDVLVLSHLKRC